MKTLFEYLKYEESTESTSENDWSVETIELDERQLSELIDALTKDGFSKNWGNNTRDCHTIVMEKQDEEATQIFTGKFGRFIPKLGFVSIPLRVLFSAVMKTKIRLR